MKLNIHKLSLLPIVFLLTFFIAACGSDEKPESETEDQIMEIENNDNKPDREKFFVVEKEYPYEEKSEFEQDLEAALDDLNNEIDRIESKMEDAEGDAKEEYQQTINDLKEKRDKLNNKLDELENQTEENWEDFKTEVSNTWNDIEKSWNKLEVEININDNY